MNGCKKVSVYYEFIQRTSHAILFVDEGTIKSASTNFEIARVLEHRCIQRRVTSIEGFRGSGSLVDVSPAVAHVGLRSLVGENFGLNWNCGSDEMKMLS